MSRVAQFRFDMLPADLREGDLLLMDPDQPAATVDWHLTSLGYNEHGVRVASYVAGDGTAGDCEFLDESQELTVVRGPRSRSAESTAGWRKACDRIRVATGRAAALLAPPSEILADLAGCRPNGNGHHAASSRADNNADADASPVPPANTINDPHVPESAADIDPDRATPELPASTSTAKEALAALHAAYPAIPSDRLRWTFTGDLALGKADTLDGGAEELCGLVATYAAFLGSQVVERQRGDGHAIVATSGTFQGVRIAVEVIVARDVAVQLGFFEAALADLAPQDRIPELDDGEQIPLAAGRQATG